ncbi:MAG TPA: class I SAM-dependent methyltransferase [Candidatus Paceibacterota bacterium]
MDIKIFYSKDWHTYSLLDTGDGEKLERFGPYTFVRPLESAMWPKTLSSKEWAADGKFWSSKTGAKKGWQMKKGTLEEWEMSYKDIKFFSAPTPFRHFGFFPEQATHWDFIEEKISLAKTSGRKVKFLNLFGYTGVASLFALRAGAEVTHVDASKQSLGWIKENQKLSGLEDMPMRIIEDDVLKFLAREEKRGNKYDAVIMDPPKHGRGPKGEIWQIEKDLPKLLEQVKKILVHEPLFVILTSYTTDYSSLAPGYALGEIMKSFKGKIEVGELCLKEESNDRLVSLANTAVWSAN